MTTIHFNGTKYAKCTAERRQCPYKGMEHIEGDIDLKELNTKLSVVEDPNTGFSTIQELEESFPDLKGYQHAILRAKVRYATSGQADFQTILQEGTIVQAAYAKSVTLNKHVEDTLIESAEVPVLVALAQNPYLSDAGAMKLSKHEDWTVKTVALNHKSIPLGRKMILILDDDFRSEAAENTPVSLRGFEVELPEDMVLGMLNPDIEPDEEVRASFAEATSNENVVKRIIEQGDSRVIQSLVQNPNLSDERLEALAHEYPEAIEVLEKRAEARREDLEFEMWRDSRIHWDD